MSIKTRLQKWKSNFSFSLAESLILFGAVSSLLLTGAIIATDFSIRRFLFPDISDIALNEPVGKVTYVLNKTLRQRYTSPEFKKIVTKDQVFPGDALMAGENSALRVELDDGSVIELADNSMVRIAFIPPARFTVGKSKNTLIEVVSGVVATKAGKQDLTVKSRNKTYKAKAGEKSAIEISRVGKTVQDRADRGNLIQRTRAKIEKKQKAKKRKKRKRTRVAGKAATAKKKKTVVAKAGRALRSKAPRQTVRLEKAPPELVSLKGKGRRGSWNITKKKKYKNKKNAGEQLLSKIRKSNKRKLTLTQAFEIVPKDGVSFMSRDKKPVKVKFRWDAEPVNAEYRLVFGKDGGKSTVVNVKAKGDSAKYEFTFPGKGTYRWKIEDKEGNLLSTRYVHINRKADNINLWEPVIVGRNPWKKKDSLDKRSSFLFRWDKIPGVKKYEVIVARKASGDKGVLETTMTDANEFLLPYTEKLSDEELLFSVKGIGKKGLKHVSRSIAFRLGVMPPKLLAPASGEKIPAHAMTGGALRLKWNKGFYGTKTYTVEVSTDPYFKKEITQEITSDRDWTYYPDGPGKYYWHVRSNTSKVDSPFSETWEFEIY